MKQPTLFVGSIGVHVSGGLSRRMVEVVVAKNAAPFGPSVRCMPSLRVYMCCSALVVMSRRVAKWRDKRLQQVKNNLPAATFWPFAETTRVEVHTIASWDPRQAHSKFMQCCSSSSGGYGRTDQSPVLNDADHWHMFLR